MTATGYFTTYEPQVEQIQIVPTVARQPENPLNFYYATMPIAQPVQQKKEQAFVPPEENEIPVFEPYVPVYPRPVQEAPKQQQPQPSYTNNQPVDRSLIRIDIEDLLKSEGITSVNGKRIKFGNKNLRAQNASYGAKNSNHKKRDPHTGNAMARDISIIGGNTADYAKFRAILLSNPRVRAYMQAKGWGIINEVTPAILRRTRGTGPHFHFGPDSWARRTWSGWLNNPNVPITTAL